MLNFSELTTNILIGDRGRITILDFGDAKEVKNKEDFERDYLIFEELEIMQYVVSTGCPPTGEEGNVEHQASPVLPVPENSFLEKD